MSLPVDSSESWRALVGELVCFTHDLTVTETYDLGRYGELLLADRRLYGENTGLEVDDPTLHVIRLGARERPAASAGQAPGHDSVWPLPWGLEVGAIRVGDAVIGLVGQVWSGPAGGYVVEPRGTPAFEVRNPRPATPEVLDGDLLVASFNLENYFLTLGERGAAHPAARERQTEKLVAALAGLGADVIAVSEVERDEDGAALLALAAALNAYLETDANGPPSRRYLAVPEASASAVREGDAIRQGFLIDPAVVEVVSLAADTAGVHERPPQALTLRHSPSGEVLTLVAVHLRSKGGCPSSGDVDMGFGCWNSRRTSQARSVLGFSGRYAGVLVLGDLNAHRFEPPMEVFEQADWSVLTDLVPREQAVSYVYFGRSAALDHALADPLLAPRVTGLTYWSINADEPPLAGPGRGAHAPPGYRPDAYRSSDHDPLLVGLRLGTAGE